MTMKRKAKFISSVMMGLLLCSCGIFVSNTSGSAGTNPSTPNSTPVSTPDSTMDSSQGSVIKERMVKFVIDYKNNEVIEKSTENGLINYFPTKEGFKFNGWWYSLGMTNDGPILSEKFDTSKVVEEDNLVLYAEWVATNTISNALETPVVQFRDTTFYWNEIENSSKYEIIINYQSEEVVNEKIQNTSYTIPNNILSPGYYVISVRAIGDGINWVNSQYATKNYSYHALTKVENIQYDNNTSLLTWSSVKNADYYVLFVGNKNAGKFTNSLKYDMSGYNIGTYNVRINAYTYNDEYYYSTVSQLISVSRLATPEISYLRADLDENKYLLKFDSCNGATNYLISVNNEDEVDYNNQMLELDGNIENIISIRSYNSDGEYPVSAVRKYKFQCLKDLEIDPNYTTILECSSDLDDNLTYKVGFNKYEQSGVIQAETYSSDNYYAIWLSNKITSIESEAFNECGSLISIVIPESVTSISDHIILHCFKVESLTLPFLNKKLSMILSSFYRDAPLCNAMPVLKEVIITGGTTIPSNAFGIYDNSQEGCKTLTSVVIPNSVTSIGYGAFYDCSSLTSIVIPNSVTSIGDSAFSGCTSLTSIVIPNSVISIGSSAFSGCSSLESITLPFVGASRDATGSNALFGYIFGNSSYTGGVAIKQYYNPSSSYKTYYIPSSLKEVIITDATKIGYGAFYACSSLTSIVIPDSVTSIGENAFYGCEVLQYNEYGNCLYLGNEDNPYLVLVKVKDKSITEVTISNGTRFIKNSAFYDCSSLTSITLPNSVTSIGNFAFYGCSKLISIVIPNSVTSIGASAFSGCNSLKSVTFEEESKLASIGNDAFKNCSFLTSIVVPTSVTSIGASAFSGCSSLESITIPFIGASRNTTESSALFGYIFGTSSYTGGVAIKQYYGDYSSLYQAYYIPSSLKEVIITNATKIGYGAFYNCGSLTSIVIPTSVTNIGNYAFSGCSSLTSIVIPTSVTSIGDYVFRSCSKLTSVTFEEESTLASIGYSAFKDCSSLTSIVIPTSVTSIGDSAFYNCSYLTIYCGASSEPSGWYSNWNYSNRPVYWGVREINYLSKDGVIYVIIDENAVVTGHYSNITSVVIPKTIEVNGTTYNVTSIGEDAFLGCSSITSVEIPSSVTSIESNAFRGCSSLTSITFEEGSMLTSIGDYAFYGCSSLTSIVIPNSVTSIGNYAFLGCDSLQYNEYRNCLYLGNEDNPYLVLVKAKDMFITEATISNSTRFIMSSAFEDCDFLTSIVISNSVTSIGASAFFGCNSLKSVTFEEGSRLTTIGYAVFSDCYSLKSIVIPNSVTSIGASAFYGCSSLIKIVIPNSVTSIGASAFYYCYSLTSINIPNGVTSVGDGAFYGCSSLITIVIPNSVTSIGERAFYGCHKLTIYCESSIVPDGWSSVWNLEYWNPSDGYVEPTYVNVVWGYKAD